MCQRGCSSREGAGGEGRSRTCGAGVRGSGRPAAAPHASQAAAPHQTHSSPRPPAPALPADVRLLLAGKEPQPAECIMHPGRKVCKVDL